MPSGQSLAHAFTSAGLAREVISIMAVPQAKTPPIEMAKPGTLKSEPHLAVYNVLTHQPLHLRLVLIVLHLVTSMAVSQNRLYSTCLHRNSVSTCVHPSLAPQHLDQSINQFLPQIPHPFPPPSSPHACNHRPAPLIFPTLVFGALTSSAACKRLSAEEDLPSPPPPWDCTSKSSFRYALRVE